MARGIGQSKKTDIKGVYAARLVYTPDFSEVAYDGSNNRFGTGESGARSPNR